MSITFDDPIKQDVWETVRKLNDCWTKSDGKELVNYFHENMVAITPVDRNRREGQKACIDGWAGFAASTKILYWHETNPKIDIYSNTAIVTYYFDMAFEMGGKTIKSDGRDMLVFINENGKWWAVADQFSPYPV